MTTLPLAPATASDIIQVVADYYGVPINKMIGMRNLRSRVRARHIAMHLLRKHTRCTLEQVGKVMGGRHHTTCTHGLQVIAAALEPASDTDGVLAAQIREMERRLRWKKLGREAAELIAEESSADGARSVKSLTPPATAMVVEA